MAFKKLMLRANKLLPPKMVGLIIALLFIAGFLVFFFLRKEPDRPEFYQDVAVYILVTWLAVLIIYYSWVIGFYNINFGWTDEDWERWEKRREYDPSAYNEAPKKNPHCDETLGIPNGTVRGTIAVSLMVLAVAMMIASLTFDSKIEPSSQFLDNFKFFKDAFLLMIAFYFGNKGLELIKGKQQPQGDTQDSSSAPAAVQPTAPESMPEMPAEMLDDMSTTETAVPDIETSGSAEEAEEDFKDPNSKG